MISLLEYKSERCLPHGLNFELTPEYFDVFILELQIWEWLIVHQKTDISQNYYRQKVAIYRHVCFALELIIMYQPKHFRIIDVE